MKYVINETLNPILVRCGVTINHPKPLMDLKDENMTIKRSKDLKSIKEVKTIDTKDSTKKN